MNPLILGIQHGQNHREGKWNGECQGLAQGGMESYYLVGTEFQLYKMKRVMEMDCGDGCTTL